jgi:hypothetical protein
MMSVKKLVLSAMVLGSITTAQTVLAFFPSVTIATPSGVYIWTAKSSTGDPIRLATGAKFVSFVAGSNYLYVVNGPVTPNPKNPATYMCRIEITGFYGKSCQADATQYSQSGPSSGSKNACGPDDANYPVRMMGLQLGHPDEGTQIGGGCGNAIMFNHISSVYGPYFQVSIPGLPA